VEEWFFLLSFVRGIGAGDPFLLFSLTLDARLKKPTSKKKILNSCGGTIVKLGTARHHDTLLDRMDSLDLPGCFAMTEQRRGDRDHRRLRREIQRIYLEHARERRQQVLDRRRGPARKAIHRVRAA
jgi:hypothetical protein